VERNRDYAEELALDFPLLADPELEAIDAFGLRHAGAGPGGSDIARPAIYVADGGVLRWRTLTDNYRVRPRPEEILAVVAERAGKTPR
jgi:peroxiredoxin